MKNAHRETSLPTASMSDIAFLLLIFFLVTTTISSDAGLAIVLPPHREEAPKVELLDRDVMAIRINSRDQVLIEGERIEAFEAIDEKVKLFVLNQGKNPAWSTSPAKAVVSILTDRNTSQKRFIQVLDEVHEAYNTIYADRLNLSAEEWRKVLNSLNDPASKELFDKARGRQADGTVLYPMQISISEPLHGIAAN